MILKGSLGWAFAEFQLNFTVINTFAIYDLRAKHLKFKKEEAEEYSNHNCNFDFENNTSSVKAWE